MAGIVNEVPCVNPAASGACAHPASMHDDVAEGTNAGACLAEGCDCAAMVPDPKHPDAPPEADGKVAAKDIPAPADGKAPAPAAPAAPAPAKAPPFPPKKAGAGNTVETLADGTVRVYSDGVLLFDSSGTDPLDETPAAPADTGEAGKPGALGFTLPVMVLEGVATGDRRQITAESLTTRELPLPLMAVTSTTAGHDGAELVGRIETAERFDASTLTNPKTGSPYGDGVWGWKGTGTFTSLENAQVVGGLIRDGFLRGVSVDMSDVTAVVEFRDAEGNAVDPDSLTDEEWLAADMVETITSGRLMGATVCPFPAFEGAYIVMDGDTGTDPSAVPPPAASIVASGRTRWHSITVHDAPMGDRDCGTCSGEALVASAGPMKPPAAWFDDPQFTEITPLTVTDDGRIYGHLAAWGQCHTGVAASCIIAPKSRTQYGYFRTGYVVTAEGEQRSTGAITLGTGHAGDTLAYGPAKEHYDHTGFAVADVAAGEDAFGIWVNGATRPDITELQVRQLRASALSGDWRSVGGHLEMIAALAVNVQGFPIQRAMVASGLPTSLVAAGALPVLASRPDRAQTLADDRLRDVLSRMDQFLLADAASKARARVYAENVQRIGRA